MGNENQIVPEYYPILFQSVEMIVDVGHSRLNGGDCGLEIAQLGMLCVLRLNGSWALNDGRRHVR